MSDTDRPASRTPRILLVAAVVVAVVVGAVLLLGGGDDPDEVDAADALAQADAAGDPTDTETADDDGAAGDGDDGPSPTADDGPGDEDEAVDDDPTDDAPAGVDAEGTWTVDTEAVPYSFADNTGTFVGFRIDEELSNIGETEAVGRTPDVTGEVTLEGTTVTAASITADAASLTTDRSQRDSRTRAALGDGILAFTVTGPVELGTEPVVGETITVDATGDLTVNGQTVSYTVPLTAALSASGLLSITSSFDVTLADHGVTAPRAGPVLSVSDVATVEVQLFLTR